MQMLKKNSLGTDQLQDIVNLFKENYSNYHYHYMCDIKELIDAIETKGLDFICFSEGKKVIGVAGYYTSLNELDNITEIRLSHLLVDKQYRNLGYGSLLEDERLKIIETIKGEKVIYASCVEKPYNSMIMKINRGFHITGFRYNYRPDTNGRANSWVLTKECMLHENNIVIEKPSELTRKVLLNGNPKLCFTKANSKNIHYSLSINKEDYTGRRTALVEYSKDSSNIELQINKLINEKTYIAIHLSPAIKGFSVLDQYLIERHFFPLSYIPYYHSKAGILEYQYIPQGIYKIVSTDYNSNIGMEFLKKLLR